MMWLVEHLLGPLVLAAVFAGVIGWCWHLWRTAPQAQARLQERARLLNALVQKAREHRPGRAVEQDALEARALYAASSERQAQRVAELERRLEAAQRAAADREDLEDQVLSLRGQLARQDRVQVELGAQLARAEDLEQRLREAEARAAILAEQQREDAASEQARETLAAPSAGEAARLAWRMRYLSARLQHLEAESDAGREQVAQRTAWRMRYFQSRVQYLEQLIGQAAPAAAVEAAGLADRQASRLRYLDGRLSWIIESSRAAVAAADVEVEDLKAALAAAAEAPREAARTHAGELQRLRWRADYLGRRVEHLEARLGETAPDSQVPEAASTLAISAQPENAPAPVPPLVERRAEPAPAVAAIEPDRAQQNSPSVLAAARPPRLAAPRNGAPDDLRLIQGVTPQIESKLHASGVYHFDQIAGWSPAQAAWMDSYLALRGQVARDEWARQCRKLMQAERTPAVEPA